MSLLVQSPDGQLFCDWRLNVQGCTDSWFFSNLLVYTAAMALIVASITLFSLWFRVNL